MAKNALELWRPFEKEIREQAQVIQDKTIDLAECALGMEYVSENILELAKYLLISAESLKTLVQTQAALVTELGVASMNPKQIEIENDLENVDEYMLDSTFIIDNWDMLIRRDAKLLTHSLKMALPPARQEALEQLPAALLDEWLDAILEIKAD